jgi:hypothetical protein
MRRKPKIGTLDNEGLRATFEEINRLATPSGIADDADPMLAFWLGEVKGVAAKALARMGERKG